MPSALSGANDGSLSNENRRSAVGPRKSNRERFFIDVRKRRLVDSAPTTKEAKMHSMLRTPRVDFSHTALRCEPPPSDSPARPARRTATPRFGAIVAIGLLMGAPAAARICTTIDPIPPSNINCASAAACEDKLVGSVCGAGLVCVPFAARFRSACCSCDAPLDAFRTALRCDDDRAKAEAKFIACHTKESSKVARRASEPRYDRCRDKFETLMQRVDNRHGADCPARPNLNVTANTIMGLLGDPAAFPSHMLICGPGTHWDPTRQLCVAACP